MPISLAEKSTHDAGQFATYNVITYASVIDDLHNTKIGCAANFSNEDGSIASSGDNWGGIYVIKITAQPNAYAFQRPGGSVENVAVKFQNSAAAFLSATFQWCRSKDVKGETELICFDLDKPPGVFTYDASGYTKTTLIIRANASTADHFYWAKVTYSKRLLDTRTSDVNVLESSKMYLVLDGKTICVSWYYCTMIKDRFTLAHEILGLMCFV